MDFNKSVSIETLILANHVDLAEGRLFISGGGWTIFNRIVAPGGISMASHFGAAIVVAVPWHQTNLTHILTIELRDEDAKIITNTQIPVNVGRPAGLRHGTIQHANTAWSVSTAFPHPGGYEVVARIEGLEGSERRWTFQVQDVPVAKVA